MKSSASKSNFCKMLQSLNSENHALPQCQCKQSYDVGAAWTEGKCSTGVDVCAVQKLQHTDEVGTVSLEKPHTAHRVSRFRGQRAACI